MASGGVGVYQAADEERAVGIPVLVKSRVAVSATEGCDPASERMSNEVCQVGLAAEQAAWPQL
ncbi:hypothetical protein PYCC9005_002628 [Savitreella phatthalungensis]